IIGAHNNLLKYEDVRVLKDMRNSVNRMVNCETANLNKTIDASVRQIESINYFKENNIFDDLPDNLKQTAELRLQYPDLSLKELGQLLDPVLGKSGVNYRLKKIEEMAQKLQSRKGENSYVSTKCDR
ncbi:MAG TPA: DNA-binding protein WhiA, partial [Thermoanaerobacterales bacterium]|nr:DNA-binding protein WhiA [Thermoanaerobacterales bacterium]